MSVRIDLDRVLLALNHRWHLPCDEPVVYMLRGPRFWWSYVVLPQVVR